MQSGQATLSTLQHSELGQRLCDWLTLGRGPKFPYWIYRHRRTPRQKSSRPRLALL